MKSKKRTSKNKWFIPIRGSYLPNNFAGAFTYIPFITYLVFAYIVVANIDTNYWLKGYILLVQWVLAGFVLTAIAKAKS